MWCDKTALVLEGGGFRGLYSSGVIDYFMEQSLEFSYIIGVSMGAINGANYVAKQPKRMIEVAEEYMLDKRYMGFGNLIKEGNFFSRYFAFNELPRRYNQLDFKTYYNSPVRFYMVATDVDTGGPHYFEKMDGDVCDAITASSSLPLVSRMVKIGHGRYLDGGVADSVPVKKALNDGNEKAVVVLTRPKGYRKEPYEYPKLVKARYHREPALVKAILDRHIRYNQCMDEIDSLEEEGRIYVIRPDEPIAANLIEKDPEGVRKSYETGYAQAKAEWQPLLDYLTA